MKMGGVVLGGRSAGFVRAEGLQFWYFFLVWILMHYSSSKHPRNKQQSNSCFWMVWCLPARPGVRDPTSALLAPCPSAMRITKPRRMLCVLRGHRWAPRCLTGMGTCCGLSQWQWYPVLFQDFAAALRSLRAGGEREGNGMLEGP